MESILDKPSDVPTLSNELDPKLDPLIETIMQCGFEVAMGGNPFEPYDQELAFEKARATCRKALRKLIATQNTALLKEVADKVIGADEFPADQDEWHGEEEAKIIGADELRAVQRSKLAAMGEQS